MEIDPIKFNDTWFIDDRGFLHKESLERLIGHELLHLLAGTSDNRAAYLDSELHNLQAAREWLGKPGADFKSDTVSDTSSFFGLFGSVGENGIGVELGGDNAWVRASYQDTIVGAEYDALAAQGKSLTFNNTVEDVFSDFENRNGAQNGSTDATIDFHLRDHSALILGGNGIDTITGGKKADYIYGGEGADKLDGGGGHDFLDGGMGVDEYKAHDGDTILDSSKTNSSQGQATATFTGAAAPLEGDGQGTVTFEGVLLTGATDEVYCDGSVTKLERGGALYVRKGADLNVIVNGKLLVIKDFINGNLGITLEDKFENCAPPPSNPNPNNDFPPRTPPPARDPLILDLDGNGVQFISLDQSHAFYDFNGTGFATKTGWIGPNSGFLVQDQGDGKISLFGNAAQDGFAQLAALDSNGDGKISIGDANFNTLEVWRDLNSDGKVDAGELSSLASAGVAAVNLQTTPSYDVFAGTTIDLQTMSLIGLNFHGQQSDVVVPSMRPMSFV
jgi:Ca2+-binding RTX toxin-like protein